MKNIIPLIQLDKVYWWWREGTSEDLWSYNLMRFTRLQDKRGKRRWTAITRDFTLTQLLFDTDSGFMQSLEWKGQMIASSTIEVHEFRTTEYRDNIRQYHAMILAQMISDEERIQHILDNALLPN